MNKNQTEEKIVSAYEKAAQEGVDPRCIPQRLESPAKNTKGNTGKIR